MIYLFQPALCSVVKQLWICHFGKSDCHANELDKDFIGGKIFRLTLCTDVLTPLALLHICKWLCSYVKFSGEDKRGTRRRLFLAVLVSWHWGTWGMATLTLIEGRSRALDAEDHIGFSFLDHTGECTSVRDHWCWRMGLAEDYLEPGWWTWERERES